MRLPRKCSMKDRADFARVKKTGQAKAGRFVILSTLADPALAAHPDRIHHHQTLRQGPRPEFAAPPLPGTGSGARPGVSGNRPLSGHHRPPRSRPSHLRRTGGRLAPPGPPPRNPSPPRRQPVISRILSTVIRLVIRFYQRILSPMLKFAAGPGAGCRYSPSCSNYFLQAVELHGPFRGSWYGICRIFRCHPWGGSGYDPVPPARNAGLHRNTPAPATATHPHH